ncbi:MAG: hypothetical protein AABN34_08015 [Acidobacteriota bacterium]
MPDPDNVELFDAHLKNLRLGISDLGQQVDSYKTKTAGALGGGIFLLLLAAGAAYDLALRRGGAWQTLGVTRETLIWIVSVVGGAAIALLLLAFVRVRRRDINLDARLDQMEQEYAELLERRDAVARSRS